MLPSIFISSLVGVDWRYFLAGGTACSLSHAVSVPFDVLKTRIQLDASLRDSSYSEAFATLLRNEGPGVFCTGFGETISGYALQGSLKYGLYEQLKPNVQAFLEHSTGTEDVRLLTFVLSGALAEVVGSSALTPFEALRIRQVSIQKTTPSSKQATVGELFIGLPALLAKQLPFTMVQLATFETFTAFLYSSLDEDHSSPDATMRFAITFTSALLAGLLSAVASQPGDTILSLSNRSRRGGEPIPSVLNIVQRVMQEQGLPGLFSGIQARFVHVCVIVVTQLLIYDTVKQAFGIAATGAH